MDGAYRTRSRRWQHRWSRPFPLIRRQPYVFRTCGSGIWNAMPQCPTSRWPGSAPGDPRARHPERLPRAALASLTGCDCRRYYPVGDSRRRPAGQEPNPGSRAALSRPAHGPREDRRPEVLNAQSAGEATHHGQGITRLDAGRARGHNGGHECLGAGERSPVFVSAPERASR